MSLGFGDFLFERVLQLVKVKYEVTGTGRGYISLWVHTKVRMITFVGKKREDTSGSTRNIVVSKFCQR